MADRVGSRVALGFGFGFGFGSWLDALIRGRCKIVMLQR